MGKEHDKDLTYVRDYNVCQTNCTRGHARTSWNDPLVVTEPFLFP